MARSPRHRALDAFLHRLRPRTTTAFLRFFPARQEERLGQASAGAIAGSPYRPLRQADKMDEAFSRSVRRLAWPKGGEEKVGAEIRGHGRRRHFCHAAA